MDKKKLLTVMSLAIGLGTLTLLSDNTKINVSAEGTSSVQKFGDVNGDGYIDSVDATAVLIEYAKLSTAGKGNFDENQRKLADIDKNNLIDAVDASFILQYYAYASTGGNLSLEEWLGNSQTSTTTTSSTQTTQTTISTTTTTTTITTDVSKISEIKLTKYDITINVGEKDISYVTMLPESVQDKREIWTSSDEKIATVDEYGYVTGVSAGTCTVTVTSANNPNVKAEIKVTVNDPNKISEIKLSKTEINIDVGKGDISYVTMLPESVQDKREIWTSSDEKIAVVDNEGYITGVSAGTCTVTVTSANNPSVKAEIKVTVNDTNKISEIKLSKTEIIVDVGKGDISYVTMLPESVQDKREIWTSSDEKIAVVDNEGYITGVSAGTCTVTVTSANNPSVKAEIKVTVNDTNKISEIKLSKTEINIDVGKGDISYVTMLPESVQDKREIWTSSDEKIAVVDNEGYITGVSAGTCTVTVTSANNPNVKAEIKVTVNDPNKIVDKISEIKLSKTEINIDVGKTDISYVTMLPESVQDKREIWTSSDEKIAVVDNEGYITGVSAGTCTVTVTSANNPNVKAEIKVTVNDPNKIVDKISEIKLSKTEINIDVGKGDISYVTMLPESVQDKREIWTSSDEKIATVDEYGYVTGVSAGTCTVTVTSANNPTVKAEIKVTVKQGQTHKFQQVNGLTYIDGILIVNKSYSLPPSYAPEMDATTIQQFNLLSKAAENEGLNIYFSSGYRSYSQQETIYNNYISWYGKEEADTFSARPGHSEHQTGLAIDVNTIDDSFVGTPEAIWLENHAHEYGFIIRYPKGKESITGYQYEPWHIRYLGVEKATEVYKSGLTLEEYLGIDSYYH